ncbi:hypothetical protein N399_21250 [Bacillus licheniformis CG-B52]|nr:hypothetical protein N399_21250 [Bacillus licheniformis CG-B52]KUL12084.1 hypothetical protein LI17339_05795 [Bacillus licheniformis LMG 17339]
MGGFFHAEVCLFCILTGLIRGKSGNFLKKHCLKQKG